MRAPAGCRRAPAGGAARWRAAHHPCIGASAAGAAGLQLLGTDFFLLDQVCSIFQSISSRFFPCLFEEVVVLQHLLARALRQVGHACKQIKLGAARRRLSTAAQGHTSRGRGPPGVRNGRCENGLRASAADAAQAAGIAPRFRSRRPAPAAVLYLSSGSRRGGCRAPPPRLPGGGTPIAGGPGSGCRRKGQSDLAIHACSSTAHAPCPSTPAAGAGKPQRAHPWRPPRPAARPSGCAGRCAAGSRARNPSLASPPAS